MKISTLQFDVKWMDSQANIDIIENHLRSLEIQIDLLVLPEMFLTGFNMDAASASIKEDHDDIKRIVSLAREYKIGVIGSLAIKEGSSYYNRVLLITERGIEDRYDKQFRFTPSGENKHYAMKYPTKIFNYQQWKILPQVCYDLRFPENVRSIEIPDVLIYMANWPSGRIRHWDTLLMARAIENQCYTIGGNRIGIDKNGWEFPGHSQLVDYSGKVIKISAEVDFLNIEISKKALNEYRKKYPFWKDKK